MASKKEEVIRQRLMDGLDEELQFVEQRLRSFYGGLAGMLLNPIVQQVFRFAAKDSIRRRGAKQVEFLLRVARQDKPLERLVDETFEEFLQTDEVWHRLRKNHPRIGEMKRLLREMYHNRLDGIYRLLRVEGTTYEELSRNAFPRRHDLEALCQEQFTLADRVVKIVEKEGELMRVPGMMRKELIALLGSVISYGEHLIQKNMDSIYEVKP